MNIEAIMKELLPEAKVLSDVEALLQLGNRVVQLESGDVVVPGGATHAIIFRRLQFGESAGAFINVMTALLAIGGIEANKHTLQARICFCRLIYQHSGSLITSDWMSQLDH